MKAALAMALVGVSITSHAQGPDSQVWGNFTLGRNFASTYMAELEVGYQQLVEGSPQWSTFSIRPTLNVSVTPHFDLLTGFPWMDTQQTDDVHTREFRVQLGARYHVLPFAKVQPRFTVRYEWRHFNTVAPEPATSQSSRTRLKAAVYVALDKPYMSYDTLWYGFVDWETFVVFDEQVEERYAQQNVARIGLGRKFNYNWRLEVVYSLQRTRDEIDGSPADDGITNVYRLNVKYYITPPGRRTPSKEVTP